MLVWEGYTPDKAIEEFKVLVKEKYDVDLDIKVEFVQSADDFQKALKTKTADIVSPSHNLPKDSRYKYISGKLVLPIDLNNVPN